MRIISDESLSLGQLVQEQYLDSGFISPDTPAVNLLPWSDHTIIWFGADPLVLWVSGVSCCDTVFLSVSFISVPRTFKNLSNWILQRLSQ